MRYERDGETFSKYTLGTHRAFEDLEVTVGEGASRRQVILRGYESDGSQALEAVARGASEGVMKGMVPVP